MKRARELVPVVAVLVALGCSSQVDSANTSASALSATCNSLGQSALAYEASKLAVGDYFSDDCLGFVQLAFNRAESYLAAKGCSEAAADSLACARKATGWTVWDGSCPCGAILYWDANSCNGQDGHVVICNGDGTASTAGWPTANGGHYSGSTHASIAWLDQEECRHEPAGYIVPGGAPAPPPVPACVAGGVADFDGDGKSDVLVRGVSGWDTTPVFFSKGDGSLTFSNDADPSKTIFNAPGSRAFVGDFNGDGKTDVLVKGVSGWDTTPVFFSNGDGTFRYSNAADPTKTVFNTQGAQALVGDIDGDGKADVVLKNGSGWYTTPVFLSNGDGTFTYRGGDDPAKAVFNDAAAQSFIGDFNGDGRSDVLLRGVSGWDTTPVYLSNGDGTFTFSNAADTTKTLFNLPSAQAFIGDFDGDGKTDVLVKGVAGWDTTPVFFSSGDGTFRFSNAADPSKTIFNFVGAETLLGDFDGDGKTDVLLKNGAGWSTTPMFLSRGDGTFSYADDSNTGGTIFNLSGASSLCY
jgi:FG-GAP-like repeat